MRFDLENLQPMHEISERLRALPSASVPPVSWQQLKCRREGALARAESPYWRQATLAAAAAFVMVGAIAVWRHLTPAQHLLTQPSAAPSLPRDYRLAPVAADDVAARSAASERYLATLPAEPAIVHVGTRAAVTNLEDRIAWVDDTLSSMRAEGGEAEHSRALQRERNRLVTSLAQVRYAETLAADLP